MSDATSDRPRADFQPSRRDLAIGLAVILALAGFAVTRGGPALVMADDAAAPSTSPEASRHARTDKHTTTTAFDQRRD